MKKFAALALTVGAMFALTACGGTNNSTTNNAVNNPTNNVAVTNDVNTQDVTSVNEVVETPIAEGEVVNGISDTETPVENNTVAQ